MAENAAEVAPDTVELTDGIALIGDDLRKEPFHRLVITDGVVTAIDRADAAPSADGNRAPDADDGTRRLPLDGAYVLPGLIDCHVHFDLAAHPAAYEHWRATPLVRALTSLHNGLLALRAGITTVRDLGCADHSVLDYAHRVESGQVTGPRVVAAGRPITVTGGHFCQYARVADGATEVRRAVREQIGAGARVIKLMATGGISTPGDPGASQLTVEEMSAAVEEAHGHGLPVAAHAHTSAGIRAALLAGVDTIEHAAFVDDDALDAMTESEATLVPTVSALNEIAPGVGIPPATVAKSLAARERYRDSTRRAVEAGVRIAAGTDAGTALNPIGGLVDELEMYRTAGMSPIDALRSATVHAGRVVGGGLGVLDVGHPADLVVVERDPTADLAVVRSPTQVIARGRLLPMAWIEQTLNELAPALEA